MSIATQYDATINSELQTAIKDYCQGTTSSEEDCLNAFLDSLATKLTDVTVE